MHVPEQEAPYGTGVMLLGGGGTSPIGTVQTFDGKTAATIGRLPEPRSDAVAVTIGSTMYVLGGNVGSGDDPSVLSTTDGKTFDVVGQLPVAVQEAGAAVAGATIYLIGGVSNGVQTTDIQQINVVTGAASIAAHLPVALSGESVFSLGGAVFIDGGRPGGDLPQPGRQPEPGHGHPHPGRTARRGEPYPAEGRRPGFDRRLIRGTTR